MARELSIACKAFNGCDLAKRRVPFHKRLQWSNELNSSHGGGWRLKAVAVTTWLCFSICHAHVVEGTVTDSTSHQAIANVLVQEAGTGNVTLTDAHGRFALESNAAAIRPRDGKSPTNPAPDPSAPAIVSRKSGYAACWTSVTLGDTNITVPLARELEAAGPGACTTCP